MNISKIKNVKYVNKVILKPKKKNAFIAVQSNMEDLVVMNMNMKKMNTELKLIKLFAKNA